MTGRTHHQTNTIAMGSDNGAHSASVKIETLDPESGVGSLGLPPSPPPLPLLHESLVEAEPELESHDAVVVKTGPPEYHIGSDHPPERSRNVHWNPELLVRTCEIEVEMDPVVSGTVDTDHHGEEQTEAPQIDLNHSEDEGSHGSVMRNLRSQMPPSSDRVVQISPSRNATQETPSETGNVVAATVRRKLHHAKASMNRVRTKHATLSSQIPDPSSSDDDREGSGSPIEPEHSDSGSSIASNEYNFDAACYEATYFFIPTTRMYRRFMVAKSRKYKSTRTLDLDFLEEIGVLGDFYRLTSRIGIFERFWAIPSHYHGYDHLTLEFLSSLQLLEHPDGRQYIEFRMREATHSVDLDTLAEWFGFHPEPHVRVGAMAYRDCWSRAHFFRELTGFQPRGSDYRVTRVRHPVLRLALRILSHSIFARGETQTRVNHVDALLLDFMLTPEEDLMRPDLISMMVEHWLSIQRNPRGGGNVLISSYVTLIGAQLGVKFSAEDCLEASIPLDADAFRSQEFISFQESFGDGRTRYFWRLGAGVPQLPLPLHAPLDFADSATWRLEALPPLLQQQPEPQVPPSPPQQQPAQYHPDLDRVGPSSSAPPTVGAGLYSFEGLHSYLEQQFGELHRQLAELHVMLSEQRGMWQSVHQIQQEHSQVFSRMGSALASYDSRLSGLEAKFDQFAGSHDRWEPYQRRRRDPNAGGDE